MAHLSPSLLLDSVLRELISITLTNTSALQNIRSIVLRFWGYSFGLILPILHHHSLPSWELTYPTEDMFEDYFALPKVGYVNSLEGIDTVFRIIHWNIHPGRLTWNLQITRLERKMIFQTSIIVFHVNLPGCKPIPGSIPVFTTQLGGHYTGGCRLLRQLEASSIFGGHRQSGRGSRWLSTVFGGSFLQKHRTFGTFLKIITVAGPQKAKQDSMGKFTIFET